MSEVTPIPMTREAVMEDLAEYFVRGYTDVSDLDTFVKNVLTLGWNHKPYDKMTNEELLAEWDETVNEYGEYQIFITDIKEV